MNLAQFQPISLEALGQVKLMNRQDTKFLLHPNQLTSILNVLVDHYFILEIKGNRTHHYHSLYFDHPTLKAYYFHHNGKLNRYKVRYRRYTDTSLHFFEVKFKNNKKRTIKKRIRTDDIPDTLGTEEVELLQRISPLNPKKLQPSIYIDFERITLANKDFSERITIDTQLFFKSATSGKEHKNEDLCIIEVKQSKVHRNSMIMKTLHEHKVYPLRLSKYCLGLISLKQQLKHNAFKEKLRALTKISSHV